MNKKDVAAFYKDLASRGFSDLFVPPHAARVTGAARMALAGHSEGVIQIFGRWGSSVVLRYVREALLGSRGGRVATPQAACSLSLAELRSIAAKKLPAGMGRQRSHALSAAWAEQAVEQVVKSVPAQPIEWEDFKRQFDARLDELAHDVDASGGVPCHWQSNASAANDIESLMRRVAIARGDGRHKVVCRCRPLELCRN